MGKLYEKILCKQLKLWIDIDKCQAGSQEKRDCLEHILALRMLVDYVKQSKQNIFILFVDFSKAYDRVPRKMLFKIFKKLGCGKRFLQAVMKIYMKTMNILNSEYVRSTISVKQGGPLSSFLFLIYVNVLHVFFIRNTKSEFSLMFLNFGKRISQI